MCALTASSAAKPCALFELLDDVREPHQLRSAVIEKLEELPIPAYIEGLAAALPRLVRTRNPWVLVAVVRQVNLADDRRDVAEALSTSLRGAGQATIARLDKAVAPFTEAGTAASRVQTFLKRL